MLLLVLEWLVETGNTVIVIEHNLDVIKTATILSTWALKEGRADSVATDTGRDRSPWTYTAAT